MIRSVALLSSKLHREFNVRSMWVTLLATMHYTGIRSKSSKIAFSVNQLDERAAAGDGIFPSYQVTDLESVIEIWIEDFGIWKLAGEALLEYQMALIKGGVDALVKSSADIDRDELKKRQANLEGDIGKNGYLFKYLVCEKLLSSKNHGKVKVFVELIVDDRSEAIFGHWEGGGERGSYLLYRGEPSLLIEWIKEVKLRKVDNGIRVEIPGRNVFAEIKI